MEPFKEPRLRTGKKRRVERLKDENGKFRKNGIGVTGPMANNLMAIIEAIESGEPIDESLYRRPNGRSDTLLMQLGIMHIHLEPGSNELLFLRQFEDHVELIEINDHGPFDPNAVDYFRVKYQNLLHNLHREMLKKTKAHETAMSDALKKLKAGSNREPQPPADKSDKPKIDKD